MCEDVDGEAVEDRTEELKRDIEKLKERNNSLRTLIDTLPSLIYIKDRDFRFIEANLACARFVGEEKTADFIGKSDHDYYTKAEADRYRADEEEIFGTGRPLVNKDELHEMPDGTERWVITSKYPVKNEDGEIIGIAGVSHDISNLRDNYTKEIRNSRMEATATLAGGIAHKFNNLLAVILGNASLLKERESSDEVREIERAAEKAGELARRMIEYARGGKLISAPVDVNDAIGDLLVFEKENLPEAVRVETDLAPENPLVQGDPRQFDSVVLVLLRNAADAVGDAGTIRISTKVTDAVSCTGFSPRPDREYLCLEVADDGCGMDPETASLVFEPFFTTKFIGHGLGLAAAHGIVANHGGCMTVESTPGAGSTFRVFLPVENTASAAAEMPHETGREPAVRRKEGTETILVVDDEGGVRDTFKTVLERRGYTVLTAQNGFEAVDTMREHTGNITLVILDVEMPVMGGRKAYGLLKNIKPDVRVLLCSGYAIDDSLVSLLGPEDDFANKPLPTDDLCAKIRALLDA